MRELVRLTNAVAARMIVSALWGCGADHDILAGVLASVPTAADDAPEAARMNAQATLAASSAAMTRAASPAHDRSRKHHSARWLPAAV